jgi:hypothetical protein
MALLAVFGAFAAGPTLGIALARLVAPGSAAADAIGMFAFPIAFAAGLHAWLGMAIAGAVVGLVRRLASGEPARPVAGEAAAVPSGSFVFVPISIAAGVAAGIPVGLLSDTHSVLASTVLYAGSGALYGTAVWRLARAGHLPLPEPT